MKIMLFLLMFIIIYSCSEFESKKINCKKDSECPKEHFCTEKEYCKLKSDLCTTKYTEDNCVFDSVCEIATDKNGVKIPKCSCPSGCNGTDENNNSCSYDENNILSQCFCKEEYELSNDLLQCVHKCENISCNDIDKQQKGACFLTKEFEPSCLCDAGYKSKKIIENDKIKDIICVDLCDGITCYNEEGIAKGECSVTEDVPVCVCEDGYKTVGIQCLDLCANINCSEHGTCINTANIASCKCDSGYFSSGLECIYMCQANSCPNHTRCEIECNVLETICNPVCINDENIYSVLTYGINQELSSIVNHEELITRKQSFDIDDSNNIYITGLFKGSVDFDPSENEDFKYSQDAGQSNSFFLTKIKNNGIYEGFNTKILSNYNTIYPKDVKAGNNGNVFVSGNFSSYGYSPINFENETYYDSIDFDYLSTSADIKSSNNPDSFFIMIYDQNFIYNGSFVPVKTDGSNSSKIKSTYTKDNYIYAIGEFSGNLTITLKTGETQSLNTNGLVDIFFAKFETVFDNTTNKWKLNCLFVKKIGGDHYDFGNAINVDSENNIYLGSGIYWGPNNAQNVDVTGDNQPDSANYNGNPNDLQDMTVIKYDSNGNYIWHKVIGGIWHESIIDLKTDSENSVYLYGFFATALLDFNPSSETDSKFRQGKNWDLSLTKFDKNGNYGWTRTIASQGGEGTKFDGIATSIATDDENNVYATGYFKGEFLFSPQKVHRSVGGNDAFIIKYDSNGIYKWGTSLGGVSNEIGLQLKTLTKNEKKYFYLLGASKSYFTDYDPTERKDSYYIKSAEGDDIFLLKWQITDYENIFIEEETNP